MRLRKAFMGLKGTRLEICVKRNGKVRAAGDSDVGEYRI